MALVNLESVLSFELIRYANASVTVGHLLAVIGLFAFGAVLSRLSQSVLGRTMRRRNIEDEGLIGATQRLVHYAILLVVGGYALQIVGVDLRALFTAGAVVAVAIGFALQNILQNFVSGVIMLMERSITPSDVLEVEGRMVRVEKMNIRTTVARTLDDEEIIIPNSVLVQTNVKNFTLSDELYRLRAIVGVSYNSDVDRVMEVLLAAARSVPERSHQREPRVLLKEFGDSAIVFDASIWLDDPWTSRTARSAFHVIIWRALKDAEITIAYPQLDVHVDGVVSAA